MTFEEQLTRDEGSHLTVYDDATGQEIVPGYTVKGHPTIGVGRALDVNGISADERDYLRANDVSKVKLQVGQAIPWSSQLDPARLMVLHNMAFNMGTRGLLEFKNFLAALQAGDYPRCVEELKNSRWARQVAARSTRLAQQILTGEVQ